MNLEELEEYVKNNLSEKRFFHSKCVMKKCEELAKTYNVDVETAKKVGIAHDIAKEMTDEEKLSYAKNNDIIVDTVEQHNLGLLHAKIGADIAKKVFNFSNEMCDAIRYHSTAKENMSMLEKILYIADWTGDDRTFEDAIILKQILKESGIDQAILYALNMVIQEQLEKNKEIHIDTINARNFLLGGK